jgi:hypothetical protein
LLAALLLVFACSAREQTPPQNKAADLGGTAWQLVKFQGSDDKTLIPDDKAKYTITFETGGAVSTRIDCTVGAERGNLRDRISSSSVDSRSRARSARPDPSTIASSRIGSSCGRTRSRIVISICR